MFKFVKKLFSWMNRKKGEVLPKYFIKFRFLSSIYYFFISSKFLREHHAVLSGKVKHLKESKSGNKNIYTLIRNTHRIEKGLLMRPRRPVFALDYIDETTNAFCKLWNADLVKSDKQYKWFYDVLNEYFTVSGDHPKIKRNFEKFKNTLSGKSINSPSPNSIPYYRQLNERPNISFEDFYQLTKFRRSVRWFLDKKVPRELIDKAVLAAIQSPSACNRQPFQYIIVDDDELLKIVVNLPGGVAGYSDSIPVFIAVVGNLDAYFDERDRHVIYIDASLANMTFMLALETLGLSSCAINWPDVEDREKKMAKALNLEKHQRVIMCMAVGFPDPDGKVAFSEKRSLDYIRTYN